MIQITNLTDNANQTTLVILTDGSILSITLKYRPRIQRWQVDFSHTALTLTGKILCVHLNMLRQFKNNISFGLMCMSVDGVDPILATDFVSPVIGGNPRITLYVLDKTEVDYIETNIYGAL